MTQGLRDLADVEPVGEADRACLEEIHQTLIRYGAVDRFGLTLLHDHFDIEDRELLMERCDPDSRTLTIRPEPVADTPPDDGHIVETSWRFGDVSGDVIAGLVCKVGCFYDLKDKHKRTHDRVNG